MHKHVNFQLFLRNIIMVGMFFYSGYIHAAVRLSQFNYGAASVLPVYTFRGKQYAILGREALGKDKGTYDDFGGRRDKGETHPVESAAREWMEEGLVTQVTGLTLQKIRNLIDIEKSKNTETIVAYTGRKAKNVTYITQVNNISHKLLYGFNKARTQVKKIENREKDSIAVVDLAVLQDTIIKNKNKVQGITVSALVVDPVTNRFKRSVIMLRPFFVAKLRPYFLGWPYEVGKSKKIRFYSINLQPPVKQSWRNWAKSFVV